MPRGTAVFLGRWHFNSHEFEVWQRKDSLSEPFATGLFVRGTNGDWRVFCLNVDDFYAPNINLIPHDSNIAVMYGSRLVGNYSVEREAFRKAPHTGDMVAVSINQVPPGEWFESTYPRSGNR